MVHIIAFVPLGLQPRKETKRDKSVAVTLPGFATTHIHNITLAYIVSCHSVMAISLLDCAAWIGNYFDRRRNDGECH